MCNGLVNLPIGFPGAGHEVAKNEKNCTEEVEKDFAPHFIEECVAHEKLRLFWCIWFQSSHNKISVTRKP